MDATLAVLLGSAASIGLLHTLIGPDHYLPFIVLGRAEGWPLRKTMLWTGVCGLAHVLSSVVLGALGIALGWAVVGMERFEGLRGDIASFALIGFGLVYFAWGLWRSRRNKGGGAAHVHLHVHRDGSVHKHPHDHPEERSTDRQPPTNSTESDQGHRAGPHEELEHTRAHRRTLWALFIVFVLGPCEPLIPLLMVPAARHSAAGVAAVIAVFGVVTIGTMLMMVALGAIGAQRLRFAALERHVHAMAGFAILASGLLIKLFGV